MEKAVEMFKVPVETGASGFAALLRQGGDEIRRDVFNLVLPQDTEGGVLHAGYTIVYPGCKTKGHTHPDREEVYYFVRGKGIMGVTLRYPYEVRDESEYFDDIPNAKITKDMLELASHIVKTKTGHFEPKKFEDHYEDALKDLLRKKEHGEKIEVPRNREPSKVINLMDALRRSAKGASAGGARRGRAQAQGRKSAKKSSRSSARARKAG